ncbi:MAG: MBL fold metallo-hydrolase [Candidatus Aureabacteria bacterium]|nr:MBL fold metallo-hydrolase [Candidatus Auribacterota bacterium]
MRLGDFEVYLLSDGTFKLDGGSMFGVIPKLLWEKKIRCDKKNRIELALNCLLVKTGTKNILVETGMGENYSAKERKIYDIKKDKNLIESISGTGISPDEITDVILTHLHFDHTGYSPSFSNAAFHIQKAEWDDAVSKCGLTKKSYRNENILPVMERVNFLAGAENICEGVSVEITGGHTKAHQIVKVSSGGETLVFFGDIIPTANHLGNFYICPYDVYPLDTFKIKEKLKQQAIKEKWRCVFYHDIKVPVAEILLNDEIKACQPR